VADEVWMLENTIYSVISPEGCANILWRDAGKAPEAAENLKLTARDVCSLGVVERVVSEADGNTAKMMGLLAGEIRLWYRKAAALSPEELTEKRYQRFRRLGTPRE
jgi:acetyl-CoA carboxylase carboxyl transferase subunit alpha